MRAKALVTVALGALSVGLTLLAVGCSGGRDGVIRIGVIADCEGSFSFTFESALAGAELPLVDRGARLRGTKPSDGIEGASVAGKRVELLFGCDRSTRASTIAELRRLVEQEGANAVVGLGISHEGLVMRDYAKHQPAVTFVYAGIDQSTTLKDPSPNVFRFRPGPAQWAAGLGAYAYRELGWRSAVTISEDDFFGWTSVAGFVAEFCSLGGNISQRRWFLADPNFKFARLVSTIPKGIDGAFVTDGLFDTHSFVEAWGARHHNLARSLVTEDNLLGENPNDPRLLGVVAANTSPWADTSRWTRYTADFVQAFPKLQAPDSVPYFEAMEALLEALARVHGDLSHRERGLMAALAKLRFDSPEGPYRVDSRHQAVTPIYLGRMQRDANGKLVVRQTRLVPNVEQTFGGYFSGTTPAPSRTQPTCRHGHPPAWTRYRVRSTK
ncbi:MAG: branched-chain amino acid transport system substrate-binding protein [Gaiellaceae bacterium]|nr:branched-chain amino acid transport system substrate-binding protein [Gaiellaceae bacterium]